ncbi:hypothetical protein LCGC14_1475490 [marine sediment metagenome]|uniref:Uncharacterized protein n=1 Tax=marine sediment metagenome TaxID=412755 RepID=A0A0F9JB32_9ZZZZ
MIEMAEVLAIIDSRPKRDIVESKLRKEFGDVVIDSLRQNRYVTAGSAGQNPPLLVTLAGREIMRERPPEDTVGARMLKTLVTKTINDITMEQMNRIVRRLSRMPTRERGVPKRVADVLADELGEQKALVYLDKSLAAGHLKAREYDEMRSALLLPLPRKEIPDPTVRRMAAELVQGQVRLREDFRRLTGAGQQTFQKPFKAVDEDVKRMRKALGL